MSCSSRATRSRSAGDGQPRVARALLLEPSHGVGERRLLTALRTDAAADQPRRGERDGGEDQVAASLQHLLDGCRRQHGRQRERSRAQRQVRAGRVEDHAHRSERRGRGELERRRDRRAGERRGRDHRDGKRRAPPPGEREREERHGDHERRRVPRGDRLELGDCEQHARPATGSHAVKARTRRTAERNQIMAPTLTPGRRPLSPLPG